MIAIRGEIQEVIDGKADPKDNVLKNAPHTAGAVAGDDWTHPYSREQAAFPLPFVRAQQVLAERRTHRQPVRRPQPDVLLPADRRIRVNDPRSAAL